MKTTLLITLLIGMHTCSKGANTESNKPIEKTEYDYIANYYPNIYNAYYEFYQKNYKEAFTLYTEAFTACPAINIGKFDEIKHFIKTCAIIGENEIALTYLRKDFLLGNELKDYLDDTLLIGIWESPQGLELIESYDQIHNEYLAGINQELRKKLANMLVKDQQYRDDEPGLNTKQKDFDKENVHLLMEIFEEYNQYPNTMTVGKGCPEPECPNVNSNAILLHINDSLKRSYFIPKLKEYVKNGSCTPYTLGNTIDRIYLNEEKPFIMGTYYTMDQNYNTVRSETIKDLEKLDENRISIGLPPIKVQDLYDSMQFD